MVRCVECGLLPPDHLAVCSLAPPAQREVARRDALRSDAIAQELAGLLRDVVIAARESQPAPAEPQRRDSLPARAVRSLQPAARKGYQLTRLGLAVVGLVVVVAEALATDHAVVRVVLGALLRRASE